MAEIINITELVPDDVEFVYGDQTFVMPGDLDTETVFKVFKVFRRVYELRLQAINEEGEEGPFDSDLLVQTSRELHDMLLGIFQIRNPALTGPLPFGAKSLPIVTSKLLERLGINPEEVAEDGNPTGPMSRTKKPRSSAPTAPKRSRRSTGSQT